MSATGAAMRRKEDQRFVTGRGHFTDDVNRPGQAYAVFVRSPHAHARTKAVEAKSAAAASGALAVLTGADLAADKIGSLICGWMIHSKDGSPMKMAPHPALASAKASNAGDPVAPAAFIKAITDAIGTENLAMPAAPQAVWSALQQVNNSRKAA